MPVLCNDSTAVYRLWTSLGKLFEDVFCMIGKNVPYCHTAFLLGLQINIPVLVERNGITRFAAQRTSRCYNGLAGCLLVSHR